MGIPSLFCCDGVDYKCNANGLFPKIPRDYSERNSRKSVSLSDCDMSFNSLPECDMRSALPECDSGLYVVETSIIESSICGQNINVGDRDPELCRQFLCDRLTQKDDNGNFFLTSLNESAESPDANILDEINNRMKNDEDIKHLLHKTCNHVDGKHMDIIKGKEFLRDLVSLGGDTYPMPVRSIQAYPVIFGKLRESLNAIIPIGVSEDSVADDDTVQAYDAKGPNAEKPETNEIIENGTSLKEKTYSASHTEFHRGHEDDPFLSLHSSMMQSLIRPSSAGSGKDSDGDKEDTVSLNPNIKSGRMDMTPSVETFNGHAPFVAEEDTNDDTVQGAGETTANIPQSENVPVSESNADVDNADFCCPLTGEPIPKPTNSQDPGGFSVESQNSSSCLNDSDTRTDIKTSVKHTGDLDTPATIDFMNKCDSMQNEDESLAKLEYSPHPKESGPYKLTNNTTETVVKDLDGLQLSLHLIASFADIDLEAIAEEVTNSTSDPLLDKLDKLNETCFFDPDETMDNQSITSLDIPPPRTNSETDVFDEKCIDKLYTPTLSDSGRSESTSTLMSSASTPALSPINDELLETMRRQLDLIEMCLSSPHIFDSESSELDNETDIKLHDQGMGMMDRDLTMIENKHQCDTDSNPLQNCTVGNRKHMDAQHTNKKVARKKTVTFAPNIELDDGSIIINAIRRFSSLESNEESVASDSSLRKYATVDTLNSLNYTPAMSGTSGNMQSISDDEDTEEDCTIISVEADVHSLVTVIKEPLINNDEPQQTGVVIHDDVTKEQQAAVEVDQTESEATHEFQPIDKWEMMTVLDKEISNCIIRQKDALEDLRVSNQL